MRQRLGVETEGAALSCVQTACRFREVSSENDFRLTTLGLLYKRNSSASQYPASYCEAVSGSGKTEGAALSCVQTACRFREVSSENDFRLTTLGLLYKRSSSASQYPASYCEAVSGSGETEGAALSCVQTACRFRTYSFASAIFLTSVFLLWSESPGVLVLVVGRQQVSRELL